MLPKQLFKKPSIPEEIANYKEEIDISELLGDLTLARLQSIFHAVMKKQIDKIDPIRSKFGKIEKEKISWVTGCNTYQNMPENIKSLTFVCF